MKKKADLSRADFQKSLLLTVGRANVIFAHEQPQDLQPYLEESRGRSIGSAYAIVFPSTTEELAKVISTCRFYRIPVVPQGGNTGRCLGAQTDNENAVLVNLKNLNRIRAIDVDNMTITVEAGCILQDVQQAVANEGFYFPLSLGAEGSCQIGGNLATNAGGINVLRYGNARELTLGIEAVIANGTVLNALSGLRKNNTGYDLKNLLIGSEGTLGIISAVTLRIFPPESNTEHGFIAINTIEDAVACLRRLQQCFTDKVSTFELLPNAAITLMERHSDVRCPIDTSYPWYVWYKVADSNKPGSLFDANTNCLHELMEQELVADVAVAQNEKSKRLFEKIRETIVAVQKHAGVAVKNDISVPVSAIATLVAQGNSVAQQVCPGIRPYPFGHVGDGNIHYNLMRPENMTDAEFNECFYQPLQDAILRIVDGLNGSFSAEHGVGSLKVDLMQEYQDPVALDMMRRIKHAFDPFNLMNPGKVIPQKGSEGDDKV